MMVIGQDPVTSLGYIPAGGALNNPAGLIPGQRITPDAARASQGAAFGILQSDLTIVWYNAAGALWTTPQPAPAAPITAVSVSLLTPGNSAAAVPGGAPFSLSLTGLPPNTVVNASGTQAGQGYGPYQLGVSDAAGNLTVTGQMPIVPFGAWHEDYSLPNGAVIGSADWTLVAPAVMVSTAITGNPDPTQTVPSASTQPRTASGSISTTTSSTIPPDTRGTGYGTIPPGSGAPKVDMQTGYAPGAIPPGAPFTINVTGAPAGAQITATSIINGQGSNPSVVGTADANGTLVITGTIPALPGVWHEDYSVAGDLPFGSLDFTVVGSTTAAAPMYGGANLGWLAILGLFAWWIFRQG